MPNYRHRLIKKQYTWHMYNSEEKKKQQQPLVKKVKKRKTFRPYHISIGAVYISSFWFKDHSTRHQFKCLSYDAYKKYDLPSSSVRSVMEGVTPGTCGESEMVTCRVQLDSVSPLTVCLCRGQTLWSFFLLLLSVEKHLPVHMRVPGEWERQLQVGARLQPRKSPPLALRSRFLFVALSTQPFTLQAPPPACGLLFSDWMTFRIV